MINRLHDKFIASSSFKSGQPVDVRPDLIPLIDELKNLVLQLEESQRNYTQQYALLDIYLNTKQQSSTQIPPNNRLSFQQPIYGLNSSSISQTPSMQLPLRSFSSQPQKNNPNRASQFTAKVCITRGQLAPNSIREQNNSN